MGSKIDFDAIWQENECQLKNFVRSCVSGCSDVDDIVQDVYVKALTKKDTLRNPKKAVSWLYQITRNAIIDLYRQQGRLSELPEVLKSEEKEYNMWELASKCTKPFIEELDPIYRDVLLLSEIEGLSQAEVAERLGIPLPTAKARIQRGRLKLKAKYDTCHIFNGSEHGMEIGSDDFIKKASDACEEE